MGKYIHEEPNRILQNLIAPNFLTREERLEYVDEITSVSKLQGFFGFIEASGHNARNNIEAEEERIVSLENGEA